MSTHKKRTMDNVMRIVKARAIFLLRDLSSLASPFLIMKNNAEPRLPKIARKARVMIQYFIVGIMA